MSKTPQKQQESEEEKSVKKKSPLAILFKSFVKSSGSKKKKTPEKPSIEAKKQFQDIGDSEQLYLEGTESLQSSSFSAARSRDAMNDYYDMYSIDKVEESFSVLDISSDSQYTPYFEKERESQEFSVPPNYFDHYINGRETPMKSSRNEKLKKEIEMAAGKEVENWEPCSPDEKFELPKSPRKCRIRDYNNFNPFQLRNGTSIKIKKRSKTPSKEKKKVITKDFKEHKKYSGDVLDKLFPSAAFSDEDIEKVFNEKFNVRKNFINELISSPQKTEMDESKVFIPNPNIIKRMTEPVVYDIDNSYILIKAEVHVKRIDLENHRLLYAILLKTGNLFFYESNVLKNKNLSNKRIKAELRTPLYTYHLKDLSYRKVKGNDRALDLIVRDSISNLKLNVIFSDVVTRDEWARNLHYVKDLLNKVLETENLTDCTESKEFEKFCNYYEDERVPISLDSFKFIKILGRGSFGKILIGVDKKTKRHYSFMMMRKDTILEKDGIESVIFMNYLLRMFKHPFLQKLKYSIISDKTVTFIMEFLSGGSLYHHVFNMRKFSPQIAVFYGAQMASAICYIHSKSVIFRDLNLSNSFLDVNGNVKLTDFGFCVGVADKKMYNKHIQQNLCYVAPELLRMEPYAFSCDWWSFGVCFYCMLTGEQLFHSGTTIKIKENILNSRVNYDIYDGPFIKDFLKKILHENPKKRLGSQKKREVLQHDIFVGLLYKKSKDYDVVPPIKPDVKDKYDHSLYDEHDLQQDVILTPPRKERKEYTLVKDGVLQDDFQDLLPYDTSSISTSTTYQSDL